MTKTAALTLNPTPAPTLGGGELGPGFVGADFTTFAAKGTTIALGPTLSECIASSPSPPPEEQPPPPPPPSSCTITPQPPATYNVGDLQTYFWSTTGCQTSNAPVLWNLVSGQIPPGMTGPHTQGVGSGFVTGRPTTVGTFAFTVRVRDNVGATDTE